MTALLDDRFILEIVSVMVVRDYFKITYSFNSTIFRGMYEYCGEALFQKRPVSFQSSKFYGRFMIQKQTMMGPSGRAQRLMLPPMSDEVFLSLQSSLGDIVDEVPAEKRPRFLQQRSHGHFELIPAK